LKAEKKLKRRNLTPKYEGRLAVLKPDHISWPPKRFETRFETWLVPSNQELGEVSSLEAEDLWLA